MKSKDLLKRTTFILALMVTLATLDSCSDDNDAMGMDMPEEPKEFVEAEYQATISTVSDASENGNASDIIVSLEGAEASDNISEYRVIVSKIDSNKSTIESGSTTLDTDRYLSVINTWNSYGVTLDANQLDFDGDEITNGIAYKIWILTVGTFNNEEVFVLSEPSAEFTLVRKALVSTLVASMVSNDGLSIDTDGNIYASEFGQWTANGGLGTKILKITPEGTVSDYAIGLSGPLGNTIDLDGNLYVVDGNNGTSGNVIMISPDGTKTTIANLDGWPAGIVRDGSGNLYVSNYNLALLHKIDTEGNVTVLSSESGLAGCVGIALDENNNVLLSNYNNGSIYSVNQAGSVTLIKQITGLPNFFAIGYITYYNGNIYATGIGTNVIYKVSINGDTEIFAGNGSPSQSDGTLEEASFHSPNGIAVDPKNKVLYVQDWGTEALRRIDLLD